MEIVQRKPHERDNFVVFRVSRQKTGVIVHAVVAFCDQAALDSLTRMRGDMGARLVIEGVRLLAVA